MIIEQIPIGPMANFGYILGCEETRIAALIDPAFEPEKLVARARELDLDVEWILNTHGHFDHINGNEVAVEMTGAKIIAYSGATFHADHKVDHGDKIKIGNLHIDILFTPGHCPDEICFFVNSQVIFTGDVLFVGECGRTDLPGSNVEDMYMSGLRLTADDLYSVNNSSLKDAIVSLGGFCTAEMISDQGLMMTNHHCAFGLIKDHSSVNKDYLTDGFWAMNKNEELPNEGLTATFLISIESATERVLHELDSLKESSSGSWNRDRSLQKIFSKISKKKTEGTNYNARVKSFFGGNEFYLMTYITYKDVRLVGAPPSSIGKFGGDTDNWMWPRHTGDFALLRVYCAADGSPADFSEDNVPYQPKHHLPIQLDGVNEGDYTMIFGFPGRTDRYLTSYGVKQAIE